ncbi:hypothetical protein ZIOFF_015414 [Zingiber officinale]|uniref:Uncharacterized protein n=1 Tax=Zingiber officinale TaxID=94328 RepID=A0A8J5HE94_ZINOF|nr:hypothetical protein ZIOFF_015414 [Zingiber officinale]
MLRLRKMCSLSWKAMAMAAILAHVCSPSELEDQDKISKLPGQPQVTFQQFSGYVTVDQQKKSALFYYFAEAEMDPSSTKPLVIWLNGEANMLYLEAPAGVGFSYSTDSSYHQTVDDKMTARDNLIFLQRWFEQFPRYRNRDLYITGESYAEHNLEADLLDIHLIWDSNLGLLLFLVGWAAFLLLKSHLTCGFALLIFSSSIYRITWTSACNYSRYVGEYYRGTLSPVCARVMSQVTRETSRFVDKYDVTLDVCISSVLSQSLVLSPRVSWKNLPKHLFHISVSEIVLLLPQQVPENIDVCIEDETVRYLNRKDVQDALHARLAGVTKWTVCSSVLQYEPLDMEIPTITLVGSLVRAGIPVLVYSGDQDSVIPLTGSRSLVQKLANEMGLKTTISYRVWFEGRQVMNTQECSWSTYRFNFHDAF